MATDPPHRGGFFALLAEGLAFDWSGVFLRDYRLAKPSGAALGFGLFTFGMTLGRFSGDLMIPQYGERRLLLAGCLAGALGLGWAVLLPGLWMAWLGFLVMGLGCSLTAPMLFSMSMRLPGVAPAAGLATFSTFSFMAFLTGPPVIGLVAHEIGLPTAMLGVAGLLVLGGVLSRRL